MNSERAYDATTTNQRERKTIQRNQMAKRPTVPQMSRKYKVMHLHTCNDMSRNQTQAKVVRGKCSHPCAILFTESYQQLISTQLLKQFVISLVVKGQLSRLGIIPINHTSSSFPVDDHKNTYTIYGTLRHPSYHGK